MYLRDFTIHGSDDLNDSLKYGRHFRHPEHILCSRTRFFKVLFSFLYFLISFSVMLLHTHIIINIPIIGE